MLTIMTAVIFLTEVTSNTANTSTLLPIGVGIGENPFILVFPPP